MTTLSKDEIIAMAREAGATPYTNRHYPENPHNTFNLEQLEAFATLCRADLVSGNATTLEALGKIEKKVDALIAERDALRAEVVRLTKVCNQFFTVEPHSDAYLDQERAGEV